MLSIALVDSPIGPLTVAAHDERVCLLHFGADPDADVIKRYPYSGTSARPFYLV